MAYCSQPALGDGRPGRARDGRARRIGHSAGAIAPAAAAALLVASCGVPSTYAGIDLRPGAEAAELQQLAQRAQVGDKQAQLDLGIRYEEGRGVPADPDRAERLYRLAASDDSGIIYVYAPPVGKARGHVIPVRTGPRQRGLDEAQARLDRLVGTRK